MHTVCETKGVSPYIDKMVAFFWLRLGLCTYNLKNSSNIFSRVSGKVPSDFGLRMLGFIVGRTFLNLVPGLGILVCGVNFGDRGYRYPFFGRGSAGIPLFELDSIFVGSLFT